MWDSKLCLSLLLVTFASSSAQEDHGSCLLNQQFKPYHKYEYQYRAESLNAINGASHLKNGPAVFCTVDIEVPQACSFIVRTRGCGLEEVVGMNENGEPVYGPTPTSDDFRAEMEIHPLKITVDGDYDVKVYPEEGETTAILNIKRGFLSALVVPLFEKNKRVTMPTIHGMCKTQCSIRDTTDITLTRDLSACDKFVPMRDHTSPLALISGMHHPLAQLVRSSQTCNYNFDSEEKHMTSGTCTETHILIPFSYKGEYGVTNVGQQNMILLRASPYDDRVFEHSGIVKGLHMEAIEDKSAIQDKEAGLNLLRELASLPESEGEMRAQLFHKLVTMVRGMKVETLSLAVPEAMEVSRVLSYQVLAQCGTPECSSAIMQILRTMDGSSVEVDAAVFALGLVSNPSPLLINDLLEMAKFKPSKPILYALSNTVKRFYKAEENLIPEIYSVAQFMAAQLGDCSGDQEKTFLLLRVIGNMAAAISPAGPALRSAVMQCVNQPAASLSVQKAAIQVFRLTPVPDEGRETLMQVLLDGTNPLQKRIAAYLVLMKNPQQSELSQLADALPNEQDQQVKSFIISHITNILSTTQPETEELRANIREALQGNEVGPTMDPIKFSRNYKLGSVEGNMIFEDTSYLPKEVMLEMVLKAFGFDIDMMEFGMEGKGFEPTAEALFGRNGFFPDTALKTMYFVSDNMPQPLSEVLQTIVPGLKKDEMKRQATQEFMRELGRSANKLMTDLKAAQTPEALVYMKLLGNELGYLKTSDIEEMAYSVVMMIDSMMKLFPGDLMKAMMTRTDTAVYAHYIFLDNEFFLPTGTGVPLRLSLSGTFTPGIKGGLRIAPDMSEVAFMPSAGIEFVTRVGSYIPEYVSSGLEMHTNVFHESGLAAKISMERGSVKLTIPTPTTPMKLLKMTNNLVAVTGSEATTIPPVVTDKVEVNECTLAFTGMKYCYALQYTDAFSQEATPFFPFTGDSKFAVELHPVGDVTEYTATIAYELLREGDEGMEKVDTIKVVLRAESAEPTEASVTLKYNRRRNFLTADMEIPDLDFDAGLRLGVVDDSTKGQGTHSVSLDLVNKNIPQASLIGRAKMTGSKDAMVQVQLLVPALSTDATVTANMKRNEELVLELKSEIKIMDATSVQEISMNYDTDKIAVAFKSDVNAETTMLPNADVFETYGNKLLDTEVAETEMKVRDIFQTFGEAVNIYMEKYAAEVPFIHNLRVPDMPVISLPERLFMNTETKIVYYVNNERFTIAIPLPLGGKSTEELKFPPALTTPSLSLPQFGLEIVSVEIPIPDLVVPESLTLSIPLFGKAEVSTVLKSNLYDAQATFTAGKDEVQPPSYSVKFDVKGTSPIDILSVKIEGSGMLAVHDSIEAQLKTSVVHHLIEASVSITEDVTITDKVIVRSSSKIDASSPLGLNITLDHSGMTAFNTEEVSADSTFDGMFKAGPMYGKTFFTQSFAIFPLRPEAKFDSTVLIDSTVMMAQNRITASLDNGEFSFVSNTNAFQNLLNHVAELSFKENKLSLKSDANVILFGINFHNLAETSAGVSEVAFRMETNTDQTENPVYSLVTATLDVDGLVISSDATVKLLENEAVHKATLTMNKDGLTTSGTTTLQSPLSLENTFNFELDASKASLAINNKAEMSEIKIDNPNTLVITLSSLDFTSKAEALVGDYDSYTHDITVNVKPDIAAANVNNVLKLLDAEITNEAQLKAELYKVDWTGSLKATYGEEEIKHVYEVNYVDWTANAKCSTTGKILGTHMNQNTELEVVGLAARLTNDARFNSQLMRFDYNIRSSIVPFDFNLDAVFNADGDMTMYGKHSAQLYGKFLLRAQPLAFASSHECRVSTNQQLEDQFSLQTTIENNMDTVLSVQEQKTNFRLKSKMNENTFNQELSLYNTPERAGVEVSGTILTNILNIDSTDNQEYTIAGFLKYDKSTNGHLIKIPLLNNVPALLENIRGFVVYMAETLQGYINNEEFKAKLEALPQYVSDFVSQLNVDAKAEQVKQFFSDLGQEYAITIEDVEASLNNLRLSLEKLLADFTSSIQHYVALVKETLISDNFPETVIQNIQQHLVAFNEEYDIKALVDYVIETLREMVQQMDFEKLRGSSVAFLLDLDAQYEIKAKLHTLISDIKQMIETFDLQQFSTELKRGMSSINLKAHFEKLLNQLPSEILGDVTNYVRKMVEDLEIIDKINTFNAKMREFIVRFDVDKKIQAVLEKALELIKKFKIEETIQTVVMMVKDADTKLTQIFSDAVNHLKSTEMKDMIPQLNAYLLVIQEKLRSFDYNDFVESLNQIIAKYTSNVNELIRSLEIPQKLEAAREFANFVLSSLRGSMERLSKMQSSEVLKALQDMMDELLFNNLKAFAETAKQRITNLDINAEMTPYLQLANKYYTDLLIFASEMFTNMGEFLNKMTSDQKIIGELMQIAEAIITELKKAQLNTPSFTIPLTDVVVPSKTFSMSDLEIPGQLTVPEFTVLGFYTVEEATISIDDIKEKFIALIDYILKFEFDVGTLIGDINLNYLPSIPEFSIPPITLPEFSFPNLPPVSAEKLIETLEAPTIMLPVIPTDFTIPSFGKLSYEMSMKTPVYSLRNFAEVQTSVDMTTPQLTGSLTSQGTSSHFGILNFNLETTAQIVAPDGHSVTASETMKFTHDVLAVDHHATVTVSDFLPKGSIKTTVKATTAPYNAELVNEVHVVTTEGLSATTDTSYRHVISLPMIDFTSETSVMQKCVVQREGRSITVTVGNQGTTAFNSYDNTHKSDLQVIISPGMFRVTVISDTDTFLLKMKQTMNSDFDLFSYFKSDFRSEVEGSEIKHSTMVGSVNANLHDMQLELKATHSADLTGFVSGTVNNLIEVVISTREVVFVFENKGNGKLSFSDALIAKIDLQNDYSATFRHDKQHVNTVALARLNQHKLLWNLTAENNVWEFVALAAAEGEADIAFLSQPLSIPAIPIPFVEVRTPVISNVDLYELTGLKNILTNTEQTVDFNGKIVFQKSQAGPLVNVLGRNYIPSFDSLITELSFKSDIINLNMNAGLFAEDDLVLRLGATTVSEFEALKVKLDGTTSLTTKRGIKLANSLSLEHSHAEGSHDSSITLNTETFEPSVSVATTAKIALPILNLEANQNLVANTKSKAYTQSTLRIKADFDIPMIKAGGKAEAEHSLKVEGTFADVSVELVNKANMDGTVLENYLVLGVLDNDMNMYLNKDGLRSAFKVIADAKVNSGTDKLIGLDVNGNLAAEASLTKVYAVLKYAGNNEANLFGLTSTGKHIAQATVDIVPLSSMAADIEIDFAQPTNLGDLSIFWKVVADVSGATQKISANAKFISPLYSTNWAAEVEGKLPVLTVTLKSSATCPITVFLDYDLDSSVTMTFDDAGLSLTGKGVFTHADAIVDLQNSLSYTQSDSYVTVNMDINSPGFTDVNLRYAVRKDGTSATISIPSTGLLALQFQSRFPLQMNARLYGRHASDPGSDVEIFTIRVSAKDADKLKLKLFFNVDSPDILLRELQEKSPAITSCLSNFAEKYQLPARAAQLKNNIIHFTEEAHDIAYSHAPDTSEVSRLFRNTVVQYQKTIQNLLDATIRFLKETRVKLPGSDKESTVIEVLNTVTYTISAMLERAMHLVAETVEHSSDVLKGVVSNIQVTLPDGEVFSASRLLDQVMDRMKTMVDDLSDLSVQLQNIDVFLEKLGSSLRSVTAEAQDFVDNTLKSDVAESVAVYLNIFYDQYVALVKTITVYANTSVDMQSINSAIDYVLEVFRAAVNQCRISVTNFLQDIPAQYKTYVRVKGTRLEFIL